MNKDMDNNRVVVQEKSKRAYVGKAGSLFRDFQSELKKVEWPKRESVVRSTLLVLLVVTFFIVYISAIDSGLSKVFYWLKLLR